MKQHSVPVWLMGLAGGTSFGLVGGFIAFVLPQTLAARHVPEVTIASITAVAISPGFFSFVLSPMLDVWASRRAYAAGLATTAAVLTGASLLLLDRLAPLEAVLTVAFTANQLSYCALGGWLSTVCSKASENRLSAWMTVGNLGGFGAMAVVGGELIRNEPIAVSAVLIGATILCPVLVYPFIPAPGPDRRLASESFRAFWRDVFELFRRREVLIALALFLAPCGTFSLTNFLAGIGSDFNAGARFVGVVGGFAALAAGVCGSLLLPPLARNLRLRSLYLVAGIVGSLFTLGVLVLPRAPGSFALALVGENVFQSLEIACSVAITFEVIGRDNPLAATNFAVLTAAYCVPLTYMLAADGWGYSQRGVVGAFGIDAGLGILASMLLALMLLASRRNRAGISAGLQPTTLSSEGASRP
jgi:PAT family beta-lactamase induction signal transducer AmpG